ncbi:MAG TPA: glycosyltransferase family 2 protein [Paludibacter sp.]
MSDIKVSVIIPVYNTAVYLHEAIASILNQSLKEIEIIAVNDGSADNSLEILNELALVDNRLKVISFDQNVGVSVCRNTGLENARGGYIYFFDSDDILESDCLEICYQKMVDGNYDFIIFDGVSFYEDGIKPTFSGNYRRTDLLTRNSYTGGELADKLISQKAYSCSVCLCFINKEFLENTGLKFYPGVLYEDVLFTILLHLYAQHVSFVTRSFFHRRVRANSTMTTSISQKNINYRLIVCNEIIRFKQKFSDSESKRLLNLQVWSVLKFLIKSLLRTRQIKLLLSNGCQILILLLNASRI